MNNKLAEPFSIILKLVINGEIDPWNVDIVDLADKYLAEIKKLDIPDFISASKVLSTAVLLLKMKTEALELNKEKKRKKSKKRLIGIKRYYTVEELAYILKEFVSSPIKPNKKKLRKRSTNKKRTKNIKIPEKPPLFKATLEETIQFLKEELSKLEGTVEFKDLNYPNKVQSFIALLFLNYEQFINLYQEKPFGDILIEKRLKTVD